MICSLQRQPVSRALVCVTIALLAYNTVFNTPVAFSVSYSHHLPLVATSIEDLGWVTDPVLNDGGIYHDGGGGATANGYHVQIFADSATNSSGFNFVHNSVAYFGYREPGNPVKQYQFGMTGPEGKAIFSGIVPVGPEGNETDVGPIFAVWMLSGMTPMPDGQTILGVFPCLNEGNSTDFYNTMVQMNVTDPETIAPGESPPFKRLGNGRLFYANEVYYGTFALEVKPDGYLYLYGSDVTGIKLARTPSTPSSIADRNQYTYYNSATKSWQIDPLTKNDATGNIITWSVPLIVDGPKNGTLLGPNVGDVWYDNYHKTTVMMWNDAGIDATFWFRYESPSSYSPETPLSEKSLTSAFSSYAESNEVERSWSKPVGKSQSTAETLQRVIYQQRILTSTSTAIWTPPIPPECAAAPDLNFNYQGHAHPGWDPTGKTLLVSYASCANYVSMAKITWV
ncbi:hypothetical protein LAWI1_G007431 [Lachnellula willkommii]|uniref:DUF4185 domain-containing protein n=1 Tax=Lachnellula willkommii TaxID=215461 RepID=A0A559M0F9_9HELO|nr:hypothetical protein LAWI1_G007431 [Lachnellula willkommii]